MKREPLKQAAGYLQQMKRHQIWRRMFAILACVVVFTTTYMLILPAITMEKAVYCGKEAHVHGDSCFEEQLICEAEEVSAEAAEAPEPEASAAEPETAAESHTHTEDCYETVLICQQEEHEHALDCFAEPEAAEPEQQEEVFQMQGEAERDTAMAVEEIESLGMDSFSRAGITIAGGGNVSISQSISADWDGSRPVSLYYTVSSATDQMVYRVEYSDDNGSSWVTAVTSDKISRNTPALLNASGALEAAPINRLYRVYGQKDNRNYGYNASHTLYDILDSVKAGFADWLERCYVQDFGGAALPAAAEELYQAFSVYYELPSLAIEARMVGSDLYVEAVTDGTGSYTYVWEYQDESGAWLPLCDDTTSDLNAGTIPLLQEGGKDVRCRLYEGAQLKGVSNTLFLDPLRQVYDKAIEEINNGLDLGALAINGTQFTDYFYYGNVAGDSRVPFSDAGSYADYLAKLYLDNGGGESGLAAVDEAWHTYLYDLYDPSLDGGTKGNLNGGYPGNGSTYGDINLGWPKDSASSFHGNHVPSVKPLSYSFLEDGVDYSNFVSDLSKRVTAYAPGDENADRAYAIDLMADGQAKADGPVAMVLQVQTSWQMFDLAHANALSGEGSTSIGAVAKNSELANLYDIKHALLRFVDYMEENHLSGNLVLGITEVQHAGSSSMLNGTDRNGKTLCVSNDYAMLRRAILDWDSFGNCEHVHYDEDALTTATENLSSNLSGWADMYGYPLRYEDIQKVAVIIGGPTENRNSTNGYGSPLPWSVFQQAKLNSVYGIRTNNGTPYDAGLISWLDCPANNSGAAFVDGTGTTFTDKYVATTEETLFRYLVQIAEREMKKKGLEITAPDKYVENVTVADTIADEFILDTEQEIVATIYNKDGSIDTSIADNPRVVSPEDPNLTIGPGESAGTTTITYNFGTVYNTKKCGLHFSIKAKEDYIGSNNAFSNVGTPDAAYRHTVLDKDGVPTGAVEDYGVACYDTPQVNVPIRFQTTDGEEATLVVGEQTDLSALSNAIVEHAESLIDRYDQINGTLSYTWVTPEGAEIPAGSVAVAAGSIGEQSLPTRGYEFIADTAGQYPYTLKVSFAPEPVDTGNKNFSDAQTAAAVASLTKPGNVWINVVEPGSTERFLVRKEWEGGPPPDIDSITFRLLSNGIPVKGDNGEEIRYTLDAASGWETEVSGLPSVIDGVIQNYSVEEYPVADGYLVSYGTATQSEQDYAARVTLSLRPAADQDKKTLQITYRYNGVERTYTTAKGSYKSNQTYSFVVEELPLAENGEPGPCEIIGVVRADDGKAVALASAGTTTEKYSRGTSLVRVKVITNARGAELPMTGGSGTLPFTVSGLCLIAGVLVYRYYIRRRRGRRLEG